ncbi:MAG: PLP-dependent aminotransferase family protein [Eubacteriales bacterium]
MDYSISQKMINMKPSAIREIFKCLSDPSIIPFAAGNPSPQSFPIQQLSALSADIFATSPSCALQYGITEGYTPLREQVSARLKTRFNIGRDFDATIITTGGQQGIDLTSKVLCDEGDVIICENPSFIGALNAFRANGARLVGVDVEEDGMSLTGLEEALKREKKAKLIYIIPTFQNPMGITTSLEKRKGVLALAKKYGVVILEDNPYGELRFSGHDVPTIKSMDEDGMVVYCSSFSKILSAGMRVGYLTAPQSLIQKIVVAKQVNDVHTNLFFQMLCSDFLKNCDLDAHIATIRTLYGHKSSLMLSQLDKSMDKRVSHTTPEGGLFLWCTLPEGCELDTFVKSAISKKVAVVPGTAFLPDEKAPTRSFRLNYSTPSDEQIVNGIDILAEVAAELLK